MTPAVGRWLGVRPACGHRVLCLLWLAALGFELSTARVARHGGDELFVGFGWALILQWPGLWLFSHACVVCVNVHLGICGFFNQSVRFSIVVDACVRSYIFQVVVPPCHG